MRLKLEVGTRTTQRRKAPHKGSQSRPGPWFKPEADGPALERGGGLSGLSGVVFLQRESKPPAWVDVDKGGKSKQGNGLAMNNDADTVGARRRHGPASTRDHGTPA